MASLSLSLFLVWEKRKYLTERDVTDFLVIISCC